MPTSTHIPSIMLGSEIDLLLARNEDSWSQSIMMWKYQVSRITFLHIFGTGWCSHTRNHWLTEWQCSCLPND